MRAIPFDEDDITKALGLAVHGGYFGVFTRHEYPGAYPNGTRVVKVKSEEEDSTPEGTYGTVLGSIGHKDLDHMMYFIEWDNKPSVAVGCMDKKVRRA